MRNDPLTQGPKRSSGTARVATIPEWSGRYEGPKCSTLQPPKMTRTAKCSRRERKRANTTSQDRRAEPGSARRPQVAWRKMLDHAAFNKGRSYGQPKPANGFPRSPPMPEHPAQPQAARIADYSRYEEKDRDMANFSREGTRPQSQRAADLAHRRAIATALHEKGNKRTLARRNGPADPEPRPSSPASS